MFTDTRLDGGCFYLGDDEIEYNIVNEIRSALGRLNFSVDDLIISGIDMGSTAALYYGSKLFPKDIIIAKPIVNIYRVAKNERLIRPGGFKYISSPCPSRYFA